VVAALHAEFHVNLERDDANPLEDLVSYRQFSLWLSNDEKVAFLEDMVVLIRPRLEHLPAPGRRQHMLSTILFPTDALSERCFDATLRPCQPRNEIRRR
jgi:hypothetical protein